MRPQVARIVDVRSQAYTQGATLDSVLTDGIASFCADFFSPYWEIFK
jgi:hypothetical protein